MPICAPAALSGTGEEPRPDMSKVEDLDSYGSRVPTPRKPSHGLLREPGSAAKKASPGLQREPGPAIDSNKGFAQTPTGAGFHRQRQLQDNSTRTSTGAGLYFGFICDFDYRKTLPRLLQEPSYSNLRRASPFGLSREPNLASTSAKQT